MEEDKSDKVTSKIVKEYISDIYIKIKDEENELLIKQYINSLYQKAIEKDLDD